MRNRSVEIRHAKIEDLEITSLLFDSYRQFYNQAPNLEAARSFLAARITNQESVIFLAVVNNQAVGFAQLYPLFSSVSLKRVWVLNDLLVLPEWRNNGVGNALLTRIREFAVETEAKSVILETAPDNQAARRLYESNGYQLDNEYLHFVLKMER